METSGYFKTSQSHLRNIGGCYENNAEELKKESLMSDLNIQNYKNIDQYLGIHRNEKILKYFIFSHILLFKKKKKTNEKDTYWFYF